MKFLKLVLAIPAILLAGLCFSQPICGFDTIHQKRMKEDVLYRKAILENEARIKDYISKHPISTLSSNRHSSVNTVLYTIPVVVHVVHTGGAVGTIYNPTDAQITGAINYLNQVYNGTYPGTEGVGDLQVQFVLATRDPNCNATSGIDRIDGSSMTNYVSNGVNSATTGGVADATLKNFDRWDPAVYYNIWVVNKIDAKDGTLGQFIAGYAYFAGAPTALDGTVMLATQMVSGAKTLPHEIGHALSLYHPFEGSSDASTCPANTDCTSDGDKVCDTDPITYNQTGGVVDFTCRSGNNSCTSTSYSINTEHNYMNYTSCYTLFTAGQKSRMLAAMSLPSRASLASSYALGGAYPVASFTAPVAAAHTPVTSSTGLGGNYTGIINVAIAGKSFNSDATATDKGYLDKSGQCEFVIGLQKNSTYTFTATVLGQNAEQLKAWIDYNNDGAYTAAEQIYVNTNIPATPGSYVTVSGSFTVPSTAATATVLRLRVMDELSTTYGYSLNATGSTDPTYGQAEDYPVYLNALLPVTLEYIKAARQNQDVLVSWKTSAEQNAKEFEVQKSPDGISFTTIGTVAAANISSGNAYVFTDKNAGPGKAYYRLKNVDINQTSDYSQIVVVNATDGITTQIKLMNNPFADQLDITFGKVAAPHTAVQLFDMAGRKVYENSFQVFSGQNISIDFSGNGLKAGIYMLRVLSGNDMITQKVMKK